MPRELPKTDNQSDLAAFRIHLPCPANDTVGVRDERQGQQPEWIYGAATAT